LFFGGAELGPEFTWTLRPRRRKTKNRKGRRDAADNYKQATPLGFFQISRQPRSCKRGGDVGNDKG
jgi:hypothetical protein